MRGLLPPDDFTVTYIDGHVEYWEQLDLSAYDDEFIENTVENTRHLGVMHEATDFSVERDGDVIETTWSLDDDRVEDVASIAALETMLMARRSGADIEKLYHAVEAMGVDEE